MYAADDCWRVVTAIAEEVGAVMSEDKGLVDAVINPLGGGLLTPCAAGKMHEMTIRGKHACPSKNALKRIALFRGTGGRAEVSRKDCVTKNTLAEQIW